jgi:hypothetical protein
MPPGRLMQGGGKKKNSAAFKGKHLSNRVKGDLLQQAATAGRQGGETGEGGPSSGAAGGLRGASGSAPGSLGGSEQGEGGNAEDGMPSSAAVRQGLQDAAMRRREVRDGRVCVGRLKVRVGANGRALWHGFFAHLLLTALMSSGSPQTKLDLPTGEGATAAAALRGAVSEA